MLNILLRPFNSPLCIRVDVVFDSYKNEHSIKSFERARRKSSDVIEVKIMNASSPLPKDWKRFMSGTKNKDNLTNFLCEEWCTSAQKKLTQNQLLILGGGFADSTEVRAIRNEEVVSLDILKSTQEEADTRLILHAAHAAPTTEQVVI